MKKRKKIIIFILTTSFLVGSVAYRLIFVCNFELLENIIYKSSNLILQEISKGTNKNLIILGTGYSLNINESNRITEHDPLMIMPKNSFYEETVLSVFFPFESDGLAEAGKELANFINENESNYDSITLIGHSKCGVCFANATQWINNPKKITLLTTSAPFKGTHNAEIAEEKLIFFENAVFSLIYSNHAVDRDLFKNSDFMKTADYSAVADCKQHINIVAKCPTTTNNFLDKLLAYLDKKLEINGDGIVPFESQKLIHSNTIEIQIEATHASSMQKGIEILKKVAHN